MKPSAWFPFLAMDQAEAHDLLRTKYLDASSRLHDLERYLEHTQNDLHREQTYFRDDAAPGGRRQLSWPPAAKVIVANHPGLEIEFLPLYRDTRGCMLLCDPFRRARRV